MSFQKILVIPSLTFGLADQYEGVQLRAEKHDFLQVLECS